MMIDVFFDFLSCNSGSYGGSFGNNNSSKNSMPVGSNLYIMIWIKKKSDMIGVKKNE